MELLAAVRWKNSVGVPQNMCFGLQAFLREKFSLCAGNGRCVEEIRNRFQDIILDGTKRYIPKKFSVKIRTQNTIIRK
jgi:hypothetical protein